jgi:hypothetical protein
VHYVEISGGGQSMCRDLVATIRRLNVEVDNNSTGEGQPAGTVGPVARQHLPPQQIADNARQLLERHLSMAGVQQYWSALLQSYSRLLLYRPRPPPDAVCITGAPPASAGTGTGLGTPRGEGGRHSAQLPPIKRFPAGRTCFCCREAPAGSVWGAAHSGQAAGVGAVSLAGCLRPRLPSHHPS